MKMQTLKDLYIDELKDIYDACVARGTKPDMARVTLARKIASIALRLWKKGELWDPTKLTMQTT